MKGFIVTTLDARAIYLVNERAEWAAVGNWEVSIGFTTVTGQLKLQYLPTLSIVA